MGPITGTRMGARAVLVHIGIIATAAQYINTNTHAILKHTKTAVEGGSVSTCF